MGLILIILVALIALIIAICVAWRYASRWCALPCPWWLSWTLENRYIRALADSRVLLDRMGLGVGMRLLDVGSGPGRVTVAAARRVGPSGKVVAMDIQLAMLREVERRVAVSGLTNVRTMLSGIGEGKLECDSFDRALLVAVLGEIPNQQLALQEIHCALKPGGILSVTEIFPDPHYQTQSTVRRLVEQAGFQVVRTFGNFFAFTINVLKLDQNGRAATVIDSADSSEKPLHHEQRHNIAESRPGR